MLLVARAMPCTARAMPLRFCFQASKTGSNVKKAPQQAPQPQLASKPAPKQPLPVLDHPQEQGGPCGEDAPATPQEEEAPAAAPQEGETTEGEGASPKEEEAPEGSTPEGDPSAQEEGDIAPAAAGAEDQRAAWEKQWESEVVVTNIKETTG